MSLCMVMANHASEPGAVGCAYPLDAGAGELASYPGYAGQLAASNADQTGTYTVSAAATGGQIYMAQAGILASTAALIDADAGGASGTALMLSWDWQGDWADSGPLTELQANLVAPSPFVPQLGISTSRVGDDWTFLVYTNSGVPVAINTTTGTDGAPPAWAIVRFLAGNIRVWIPSGELTLSNTAWTVTDLGLVMSGAQTAVGGANEGKTASLTYVTDGSLFPPGIVPAGTKDVCGNVI